MKTLLSKLAAVLLLTILINSDAQAQNQNPKWQKMLTDTTYLKASEIMLMPGQKTDTHTHPAHFFYALTDGQLKVYYTDGKTEVWDLKAGESGFSMPERPHMTENSGSAPMKFLLVELKEHPYKSTAKSGSK